MSYAYGMAFTRVHSGYVLGIHGTITDIEIDISRGLYAFSIVGLADRITEQAKDRVSSAIKNAGLISPKKKSEKVIVSLAPAYMRKDGSGFDLAIAMGYLLAAGDILFDPKHTLFFGELSLNGHVRPARGILPVAEAARKKGITRLFTSKEDARKASLIQGLELYAVNTLQDLILHMKGQKRLRPLHQQSTKAEDRTAQPQMESTDPFAGIAGEEKAKYALAIAIAGGHHTVLIGPPGSGKSTLALRAATLLQPPLEKEFQIEVATLHSAAGLDPAEENVGGSSSEIAAPYRNPHHTISIRNLIGTLYGGPGEVTLAHRGTLLLDEIALFEKKTIDALRIPLEQETISLTAGRHHFRAPCNFTLIATANPCPCGYLGSKARRCTCSASSIERYNQKLAGPFADRIALWITMDAQGGLLSDNTPAATPHYKEMILRARHHQKGQGVFNSKAPLDIVLSRSTIPHESKSLLLAAAQKQSISSRKIQAVLRIAATIADMHDETILHKKTMITAMELAGIT